MEQIDKLRNRIDGIDRKILKLIEKRVDLAKNIGRIKKKNGLKISDSEREREVIENVLSSSNIDKDFLKKLFRLIIKYCKDEEKD